jgi:hypothetical protein
MTEDGDELDDQLSSVSERAEKLGVSGGSSTSQDTPEDESAENPQPEVEETTRSGTGGVDVHEYPNPDREVGALSDVYEKTNVFLSPEMLEAVSELWDDVEYEWKKSHDTELAKNWDFYMACFRVVLENEDLLREELGMDDESRSG